MPYIRRDSEGRIIALQSTASEDASEHIASSDPEVLAFLQDSDSSDISQQYLATSDVELVRVVEDLIELLVDKNVLLFTELPSAAQQKLINRKKVRASLDGEDAVMVGQEDIL